MKLYVKKRSHRDLEKLFNKLNINSQSPKIKLVMKLKLTIGRLRDQLRQWWSKMENSHKIFG